MSNGEDVDSKHTAVVKQLRSKAAALEDKLDEAEEERDDALRQLEGLQSQIVELRSELVEERKLQQVEPAQHDGALQAARQSAEELAQQLVQAEERHEVELHGLREELTEAQSQPREDAAANEEGSARSADFERVEALVSECESQQQHGCSLQRDLDAAREAGRTAAERHGSEFAAAEAEIERLAQQLDEAREIAGQAQPQPREGVSERSADLECAEALASECESQRQELASLQRDLEAARGEGSSAAESHGSELAAARAELERLAEQLHEAQSNAAQSMGAAQEEDSRAAESHGSELAVARAEIERLTEQLQEAQSTAVQSIEAEHRLDLESLESERQRAEALATECVSVWQQAASLQVDLDAAREESRTAADNHASEISVARTEIGRLAEQLQELQKMAEGASKEFEQQLRDAQSSHEAELRRREDQLAREEDSFRRQREAFNAAHQAAETVAANERNAREEDSARARAAHGVLQANLDAAQSAHEALFGRYSAAVDQLDGLKHEKKRVAEERDKLRMSLHESELLKKKLEDAEPPGPAQLSVSDVLISIAFEGIGSPLELRPWDTNLDDVVTSWLECVQRSRAMQPSLVRFLRHLEETSDVFPVRTAAKLVEVHEKFAH